MLNHAPVTHGFSLLTLVASLTSVGCTVTTTNAQPDITPDPSALAQPIASPSAAATVAPAAPTDAIKIPDMTGSAAPGEFTKPNPKGADLGAACAKPDDCKSGICEGPGCATGAKCVAADRMCTRDLVSFCGCDGKTFSGSGSCPGRPYKTRGSCN